MPPLLSVSLVTRLVSGSYVTWAYTLPEGWVSFVISAAGCVPAAYMDCTSFGVSCRVHRATSEMSPSKK